MYFEGEVFPVVCRLRCPRLQVRGHCAHVFVDQDNVLKGLGAFAAGDDIGAEVRGLIPALLAYGRHVVAVPFLVDLLASLGPVCCAP